VALVGLLGILLGEQVVPLVARVVSAQPVTVAWAREQCGSHVLGPLPGAEASTERLSGSTSGVCDPKQ
jgi:xanthosine utilization system XapX-like protein